MQFWVTEFGWDTNPPRKHAASLSLAARWTAESLHQMWLSGVSLVTWFLFEDYPSPSPYQSGLYFHAASLANARAKPGRTAFRFPFVAYLGKKSTVSVWGRDATSDKETVTIQLRHGKSGKWRTVALDLVERERDLPGDAEAEGDEEGLAPRRALRAPGNRSRSRSRGPRPEHRALGQLRL